MPKNLEALSPEETRQTIQVDPPGPLPRDDSLRAINAADWFITSWAWPPPTATCCSRTKSKSSSPDKEQIVKPGANSGEFEIRLNSPTSRAQTAVFLSRIQP